jgi:hypothetical protein
LVAYVQAEGWKTGELDIDSRRKRGMFLFTHYTILLLRSSKSLVRWVLGVLTGGETVEA